MIKLWDDTSIRAFVSWLVLFSIEDAFSFVPPLSYQPVTELITIN